MVETTNQVHPRRSYFRSVGYDWNIDIILEFINQKGYEKSTIIVGNRLAANAEYAESIVELYRMISEEFSNYEFRKKGHGMRNFSL